MDCSRSSKISEIYTDQEKIFKDMMVKYCDAIEGKVKFKDDRNNHKLWSSGYGFHQWNIWGGKDSPFLDQFPGKLSEKYGSLNFSKMRLLLDIEGFFRSMIITKVF